MRICHTAIVRLETDKSIIEGTAVVSTSGMLTLRLVREGRVMAQWWMWQT
ncbi:hypothetical protein BPY_08980 [Bifidobacterium psychraerophilum]